MVVTKSSETYEELRIKMSQKQEALIFKNKLNLIKKHLSESTHPLRLLRKAFSVELENYYRRFLSCDLKKNGVVKQADSSRVSHLDRLSYINPLF